MDSRPIGIFDSGVGGLSVLAEIRKSLPAESLIFLADQANIPYGAKSKSQLKRLTAGVANFLLSFDIKMLVVACNTASCYTIDYLREKFAIPIVGVIPAVKPALALTKNGKIAILSTPATAKSLYLKKLIKSIAGNTKVLKLGCAGLEEAVEYLKMNEISQLLTNYLDKVKNFGADVIVLGCTHYPFLKEDVVTITGGQIKIVDSGKAIAARVSNILKAENLGSIGKRRDIYFTTGNPSEFSKVASTLLKYEIIARKARV